jgi:hypothetical protein
MMIPTAVNINAVTGTNWESIGVTPDIRTSAADALPKVMVEICRLLSKKGDNTIYDWMIPQYESQLYPEIASNEFINSILGNYAEGKSISMENGSVYYMMESGKRKMIYMGNRMFLMDGRNDYRIRFPETGKSVQIIEFVWNDGTVDKLAKVN